ncbi:hypothetical protein EYR40_010627 [Pleurotus pulmonarius]|nr:hypothetical protein EYR40_010627 [Pleurotus pulmonarius]
MVDQSELLVYTPMINAKMFYEDKKGTFRERNFNLTHGEEGGPLDRPLVVQFCANSPEALLASAKHIENHCDAVDINLGCPQEIAKRGRYGSFLQDDWELIYSMINTLHKNLAVPVTAKFRIFTSIEKTVEYAKMLERAAVKDAVSIPVFANGNILYHEDIQACLDATGCDGVMSAEGQLYNAALFAPRPPTLPTPPLSGLHPRHADLALEYLSIVSSLKTPTSLSAIKGHLFKFMRPALSHEPDLREKLGRVRASDLTLALVEYREIVTEMKARMDRAAEEAEDSGKTWDELITVEPTTGLKILPHWLAQPYFRPLKSREPSTKLQQGAVSHDGEPLPSTGTPSLEFHFFEQDVAVVDMLSCSGNSFLLSPHPPRSLSRIWAFQRLMSTRMLRQDAKLGAVIAGNYITVEEGAATVTPSPTAAVETSTLPAASVPTISIRASATPLGSGNGATRKGAASSVITRLTLTPNVRGRASPHLLTCSLDMVDGFSFLQFTVPHLCKHALELSLVFSGDIESIPGWMDECLGRFRNLRDLELIYWSDMEPTLSLRLAQGIASLLGPINLKYLSLLFWNSLDDLFHILPTCSATLERLTIQGHDGYTTVTMLATPSVVRLEALRNVELHGLVNPFTQTNTIECPNLESFSILHYQRKPWELPPWIPASIHKLVLQVSSASGRLQFTRPIYPASLTIELNSRISEVVWVTECINHLPFLDHLRRLEIKISSGRNNLILPASAHYEALCCLLQPLQRPTLLVHIIFSVDVRRFLDIGVDELEDIRVREAARLGEAFAPLIKAGGFLAQLVVRYRGSGENPTEVAMQCSV